MRTLVDEQVQNVAAAAIHGQQEGGEALAVLFVELYHALEGSDEVVGKVLPPVLDGQMDAGVSVDDFGVDVLLPEADTRLVGQVLEHLLAPVLSRIVQYRSALAVLLQRPNPFLYTFCVSATTYDTHDAHECGIP